MSQVDGFGKVDARLGGYPSPQKRLLDSYLLSCDVPEAARHRLPVSVSLLTTECPVDEAASNNLKIFSKSRYMHFTVYKNDTIKRLYIGTKMVKRKVLQYAQKV